MALATNLKLEEFKVQKVEEEGAFALAEAFDKGGVPRLRRLTHLRLDPCALASLIQSLRKRRMRKVVLEVNRTRYTIMKS